MTLVFFALIVCVGACVWNGTILEYIVLFVGQSVFIKIAISAVLAILLVLSFRTIFVSTGKKKSNTALAASTDDGGIYINLDTINDLASKAIKKIEDVKELRVRTIMSDTGADISIKVALTPESVIPEISAKIQKSVKSDIETLCGIAVKKINIQVDNSLQSQKTK